MPDQALTVAVGAVSGVLSGLFGIGGGIVTTPAIRLVLGHPALIAVGTPLPVILPGAITGAIGFARRGEADLRAGLVIGAVGAVASVAGAAASAVAGGTVVMLLTAGVVVWAAADMALQARGAGRAPGAAQAAPGATQAAPGDASAPGAPQAAPGDASASDPGPSPDPGRAPADARSPLLRHRALTLAGIGLVAGAYSGLLGLGGGFVVVPALTRLLREPVKRAIGTSLVAVAVLAVPGTAAHAALGHVDWALAGLLAVGVVPGAWLGSRIAGRARDAHLRLGFAVLLAGAGVWLAVSELYRVAS